MSPPGKKAVAAEFERLLRQDGLDFHRVRAGLPHRTVYGRVLAADLTVLLLLHWHSYREQFCVEVGWLFRATFDAIGSHFDASNALRRDAVILPMNVLAGQMGETWRDGSGAAAGAGREGAVGEAFAEVVRLGLPYLDRVAQAKKHAAPGTSLGEGQ